jgi:HTH-type transcriptional regulator / antitoxin HigA
LRNENQTADIKKRLYLALSRLEKIFDSKPGTPEGYELEILEMLIEKYESTHPIEFPDPIEAIKFRMEQLGFK